MLWDLDLCQDIAGTPVVPFPFFVSPKPAPPQVTPTSLPQFSLFPLEVQLEIFSFCDLPTLYQLMHTSSWIRTLTRRRVWSQLRQIWYHVEVASVKHARCITHELGRTLHCPEFASHITQVELSFRMSDWKMLEGDGSCDTVDKARAFWGHVKVLFPSTQKVVLSGVMMDSLNRVISPAEQTDDTTSTNRHIEPYLREAPPNITPLVALVNISGCAYQLWQWTDKIKSEDAAWSLIEPSWVPKRAIIPVRRLSPGVLNDLITQQRKRWFWNLERKGISNLIRETHFRYAPGPGIECCNSGCDATLLSRGEWEEHVMSRCSVLFGWRNMPVSRHTPDDVRLVLEKRRARVEELSISWHPLMDAFVEKWGASGRVSSIFTGLYEVAESILPSGGTYQ